MENKGFKFFKKGSAFLIAPALFSSFLPGTGASTVGGTVVSKAASESAISKFGAGAVKFLGNHWVKLVLLVGAGVLVWWLWTSNKSDEFSGLGEEMNNINRDFNDDNINNNFNGNNNNGAGVQEYLETYRKEVSDLKEKAVVDTVNRVISFNNNRKIYYSWFLSADGTPLIKLIDSIRSNDSRVYELIFPTNKGKNFFIRVSPDQQFLGGYGENFLFINSVDLDSMEYSHSGNQEFNSKSFEDCLAHCGKVDLCNDVNRGAWRNYSAAFELIRDNDPNFWNMRNDPNAIYQDILQQQQKKMMAMNNNGMVNMGNNIQQQMMQPNYGMPIQGNNQGFNYNMPPNNNIGNNNNQNMGNPQGMNNGFQGNNNNNGGFPQKMGMNNPQFLQGQPGYNNNNNVNNFNNNMPQQQFYGNGNNF